MCKLQTQDVITLRGASLKIPLSESYDLCCGKGKDVLVDVSVAEMILPFLYALCEQEAERT